MADRTTRMDGILEGHVWAAEWKEDTGPGHRESARSHWYVTIDGVPAESLAKPDPTEGFLACSRALEAHVRRQLARPND